MIHILQKPNKPITLQWIPSNTGNKVANDLEKEGSKLLQTSHTHPFFITAENIIKKTVKKLYQQMTKKHTENKNLVKRLEKK